MLLAYGKNLKIFLGKQEKRLLLFINKQTRKKSLNKIFLFITNFGSAQAIIGASLVMIFLGNDRWQVTGIEASLALILSHFLVVRIKQKVARPRPFWVMVNINPLGKLWRDYSFPSGHTASSTCLALITSLNFPGFRFLLFLIVGLVAVSRLYLGVHYPSDVFAGFLVGIFSSLLIHLLLYHIILFKLAAVL
ncbi:phosphatase PAP2 family protein [Carboxydothermus pertinax]|uniref:Phosphatase PAP2 family protein n=1 Tax=Carboxydothermus pertinax TaxID=870242 RepID=A0A1L8CX86_9THEO|nr:phosphatase PAP2 family protein [Carboxydothermus pertinax]GAV23501.1 phosphatase PAP2 family protein [Carboxydothermus pertinax]